MLRLRKHEDSVYKFLLEAPSSKLPQLRRKIRDLGGCHIDSKYFDKSATHLVTDAIKCSEKFLGACVRGLWVLPPKYIEDSFEVGLWLDEKEYEYSLSDLDQPSDLIAAARRWRWKVSTYQEHPFTGMQVALAMESNSIFYEKLLLYGGAQISKLAFPLHNDILLPDITFVFMDQSYKKHATRLTEHGVVCLHYMYITDAIIKDEELDILNYMIHDGPNISDSLDRKLYHLTGPKHTCIVDINLSDQTSIQEIKVDSNLIGLILPADSESVPSNSLSVKQQNDAGGTSTSLHIAANKSPLKVVSNDSKGTLSKIKHMFSKSINNNVELTMFEAQDTNELMSAEKAIKKTQKQSESDICQQDLSWNELNIPRALSTPRQKYKVSETNSYEHVPKKRLLHKSLNDVTFDTTTYTSHTTETNVKLSILKKSGKHNSDYQGVCHQDLHLHPIKNGTSDKTISQINVDKKNKQGQAVKVTTVSSNSIRNLKFNPGQAVNVRRAVKLAKISLCKAKKQKHKGICQPKSLSHLQVNVHQCNQQSHMSTAKVSSVPIKPLVESHMITDKLHLKDTIICKSADVNINNSSSNSNNSVLEICNTVSGDCKVLNVTKDSPKNKSAVNKLACTDKCRNLWSDSITDRYTDLQPQQMKEKNCLLDPSVSVSLKPNVYLYGLNGTSPIPSTSDKQINSPFKKRKKVTPSSTNSPMTKQACLERFGFSPLKKDQNNILAVDAATPICSNFRIKQERPIKTAVKNHTKRGLARKKSVCASVSQTDLTIKESLPLPSIGNDQISSAVNKPQHPVIVISDEEDLDLIQRNCHDINVNDSPSKSSSRDSISNDVAPDTCKASRSLSAENVASSSMLLTKIKEMPSCSRTGVNLHTSTSEYNILKNVQKLNTTIATNQEHSKPNRSLFDSILTYLTKLQTKTTDGNTLVLKDTHEAKTSACLHSVLSADKNMLTSPEDKKSADIKGIDLFKKEDISDKVSALKRSPVEDYIDLPTPPSVVVSEEIDVQEFHDVSCTANCMGTSVESSKLSFADKSGVARTFSSTPKELKQLSSSTGNEVCDKNITQPIEVTETFVLCAWPLTYPLNSDTSSSTDKCRLPSIYGKWMESAREMGFNDYAITHARPVSSRAPTSLLLSELVQLVWYEDVYPQAITYLYTWLDLHPPITSDSVSLYIEAFELTSENSVLLDIIRSVSVESKHKSAVLLLEYFVSLFEVNFDYCLRSRNKALIKNCLIVKWLWGYSFAVVSGGVLRQLLRLFGKVISEAQLDYRAYTATCALLNMACECLRLAGVQWVQDNPKFIMDSVITLSHDLVKHINSSCISGNGISKMNALSMFKPDWLRTLLTAILLSHYNPYLLSDPIHVNKISLNSIVSQFFFLVPQLEPRSGLGLKGVDGSEQSCPLEFASKSLEEVHDLTKVKVQKGTLTASKVNKRNGKGESLIHIACMKSKAAELERLLAVPGADINLRDNYGWTPLHEACNHGSYACAELLLKYVPKAPACYITEQEQKVCKVEIDAVGPEGLTPLHDAVRSNKIEVCKLLLSYGGQKLLKSKTHNNYTAIDLAQSNEMREVLSSFCESTSQLDLSISQESEVDMDAVSDTAPQLQRYKELTGIDGRNVISRTDCEEFLMLLMMLVASYYSVMESVEKNGQSDVCLDPKDKDVLANMNTYVKLFSRHLKKLTRTEDFEHLQFRLELFKSLCVNGPK